MKHAFFSMLARMKYIKRWALMRNAQTENISEHSHETAVLAHALAVIGNRCYGHTYDVARTALLALYHDTTEIITGDMPTPIKYYNREIQTAYQDIEQTAAQRLLTMLPDELRPEYAALLLPQEEDAALWQLVKAADKLSALIKCTQEAQAGNNEFAHAAVTLTETLQKMKLQEVDYFLQNIFPTYSLTLDELTNETP